MMPMLTANLCLPLFFSLFFCTADSKAIFLFFPKVYTCDCMFTKYIFLPIYVRNNTAKYKSLIQELVLSNFDRGRHFHCKSVRQSKGLQNKGCEHFPWTKKRKCKISPGTFLSKCLSQSFLVDGALLTVTSFIQLNWKWLESADMSNKCLMIIQGMETCCSFVPSFATCK